MSVLGYKKDYWIHIGQRDEKCLIAMTVTINVPETTCFLLIMHAYLGC